MAGENSNYANVVVSVHRMIVPMVHRKFDMILQKVIDGKKTMFCNVLTDLKDSPECVITVSGNGDVTINNSDVKNDVDIKNVLAQILDARVSTKEPSDKMEKVSEGLKAKPLKILLRESAKEVAETIYQQLGGRRFAFMVGVKHMYIVNEKLGGISIRFTASRKVNYLKVVLIGDDLYDVEFGKVHGSKYKVTYTQDRVYADELRSIFEEQTGLRTKL